MLDLEKLDSLPMREGMRVHCWWRKYREYVEWNIAKRILNSHIGKPFDIAYSNFCHKIKPHHDKSVFLNQFSKKKYYSTIYYVDDNGLIQKVKNTQPKLKTYIFSDDYKTAIVHKETGHLENLFYEKWSKKIINHSRGFTYKENDKFLGYQYKDRYYFATKEDFVEKVISGSCLEVTSPRDYRYKRHLADKRKAKKSLDKKEKALKQQEYLDKQRKLMQERKRKEKEANDLKILAAGFDLKTSFRNRKNDKNKST